MSLQTQQLQQQLQTPQLQVTQMKTDDGLSFEQFQSQAGASPLNQTSYHQLLVNIHLL